jgi:hypothetical protein
VSCSRPIRTGGLIDAYTAAACVEPTSADGVPPTRNWDSALTVAGGPKARVQGGQYPGGGIAIRYEHSGWIKAVQPGDYIYPADVRLNDRHDRLYVKASGFAAGIWNQTWLYEYDLVKRTAVRKHRVHPDALPPECAMK